MNQYGEMARRHWARWLPSRYAAIENPESFFTGPGEPGRGEDRPRWPGNWPGTTRRARPYLAKAGRLGEARHRAEQIVLHEMILLPPEPGTSATRLGPAAAVARFRPGGQDDLAPSGAVSRVRANLAALSVLRTVQQQGRPATPAEQEVLARWSGWGAVPEVFDDRRAEYAWAPRAARRAAVGGGAGGGPAEHAERPLHRRRARAGDVGGGAGARL